MQLKQPATWLTRVLQGAGIGAMLIGLTFTLGMNNHPERTGGLLLPLVVVPAAGALGGLICHLTEPVRVQGGPKKLLANFLTGIAFLLLLSVAFFLSMKGPY